MISALSLVLYGVHECDYWSHFFCRIVNLGVVVHTCNHRTWEVEAEEFLQIRSQCGLQTMWALSQFFKKSSFKIKNMIYRKPRMNITFKNYLSISFGDSDITFFYTSSNSSYCFYTKYLPM